MRHNFLWVCSQSVLTILLLAAFAALPAFGQSDQKACRKPPAILNQPKTPEKYREKWKKLSAQGRVAIVIEESGEVSDAKLIEATPKEAAEVLLATAKTIKFKSRPGCGAFKTEMVFSVNK